MTLIFCRYVRISWKRADPTLHFSSYCPNSIWPRCTFSVLNISRTARICNVERMLQDTRNIETMLQVTRNIERMLQNTRNIERMLQDTINIERMLRDTRNMVGMLKDNRNAKGGVIDTKNTEKMLQYTIPKILEKVLPEMRFVTTCTTGGSVKFLRAV